MVETAKTALEFLIVFLIIYIGSYLFSFKKIKKFNRKKAPAGIKYLIFKYNIDVVKIGYKKVFKSMILCDSFIIATIYTITRVVDNIYIRLLVSFILIFPLFAGVYHLVAMYYKKESER